MVHNFFYEIIKIKHNCSDSSYVFCDQESIDEFLTKCQRFFVADSESGRRQISLERTVVHSFLLNYSNSFVFIVEYHVPILHKRASKRPVSVISNHESQVTGFFTNIKQILFWLELEIGPSQSQIKRLCLRARNFKEAVIIVVKFFKLFLQFQVELVA